MWRASVVVHLRVGVAGDGDGRPGDLGLDRPFRGSGDGGVIIETTYSLGDQVFYVWTEKVARYRPCVACGGTGQIALPQTAKGYVVCPDCYSGGHGERVETVTAFTVEGPLTVGRVDVRVGEGDEPHLEQYMARETGVGSGRVYTVDRLFPTRAEAEAFAEGEGWMERAEALRLVQGES